MKSRKLGGGAAALVGFCCSLYAGEAKAFKMGTHVAAANEVASQLAFGLTEAGGTLVFEANGKSLRVSVSQAEAYRAVRAWPDYFRAGVVGPDGFPDPLTGQMMQHGDESPSLKDLNQKLSGEPVTDLTSSVKFEDRHGPLEYRAIDFVTAMLEFMSTYDAETEEREQVLAFIIGYISHGVGDSFAHTWVNELSGGAWALGTGAGLWGSLSEEVKHVAIESMVDKLVPGELKSEPSDRGGFERVRLRAPTKFLDAFFSAQASGIAESDLPSDSLDAFVAHYRNINVFNGGFFYNYLNAQTRVADTLSSWSGVQGFFQLAETVNNDGFVNFGLDLAQIPENLAAELGAAPNPLGWTSELSQGFIDCHAEKWQATPTPIGDVRAALAFVGGVQGRIQNYNDKAMIVRRNWVRMAQCSSENMARGGASDFDPGQPEFNRDSCADVVRAGWLDEGNPDGLFRGSIRPRANVAELPFVDLNGDEKFLLELKAAFLGGDAQMLFGATTDPIHNHAAWTPGVGLEKAASPHRKLMPNLKRMLDYLTGFGFRGKELTETLMPDDGGQVKETFDSVCAAVRDPAFENCIDAVVAPVAATQRELDCQEEHLTCTAESVSKCMTSACMHGCGPLTSNSQCAQLCGGGQVSACKQFCDKTFCRCFWGFCFCRPEKLLCNAACDVFNDDDRKASCAAAAADQAECGQALVDCDIDNLKQTIAMENHAAELLQPLRQACDTVDQALSAVECLRGDPTQPKDVQRAQRRDCVVALCAAQQSTYSQAECEGLYARFYEIYDEAGRVADAVSALSDALTRLPPSASVNLAFLLEDVQSDPTYLQSVRKQVEHVRSDWLEGPPADATDDERDLHARQGQVIERWVQLLSDVENHAVVSGSWLDIEGAANEAIDLLELSAQLGLIPEIPGPAAQQVQRDVGPAFRKTFAPFLNTLQGMKLAPLGRADMERLFAEETNAVSSQRLPYHNGLMSSACGGSGANPYCDVLISFDDPNCIDCTVAPKGPQEIEYDWAPGRSIVAWNEYEPTSGKRYVTTAFPFSNSDDSYNHLYTSIFQVPRGLPGYSGFDDPRFAWTSDQGNLSVNREQLTEGIASMAVNGCLWSRIDSPPFRTAEWGAVGSELQVDVFVPVEQTNPWWVGDVGLFVTIPGAGIYNQPLGTRPLSTLSRGDWSTLSWPVPNGVRDAFLGDFADAQLGLEVNYSSCNAPILFDNLRFGGALVDRALLESQEHAIVEANAIFGFERLSAWNAFVPLALSSDRVEGYGSLQVPTGVYVAVISRPFATTALFNVSSRLSLDVFIPYEQEAASWPGTFALEMNCGSQGNRWIGERGLADFFRGEFNRLDFELPADLVSILRGDTGARVNCSVTVFVNTAEGGALLLDNLRFQG